MNKRIMVTGGAGYVGSQTCKLLANNGYDVFVLDNLSTGYKDFIKWGELVSADLNNKEALSNAMEKIKPSAVIHCAASTYVGESAVKPLIYYENNVSASLNLFDSMIANNVKNLVFSSSCAIYGNVEKAISENDSKNPLSPYAKSKLMVEDILLDLDKAYNLKYITVRYFNVAGADKDLEIGENHNPETHIIPLVINTALGLQNSIKIFGDDYPTKDGTPLRDYIHNEDLARAHMLAMEYLFKNQKSDSFNLGTGVGYSVKDIIATVEKISGKKVKQELVARRDGDANMLIANNKKANEILKWTPQYNNIEQIIQSAYNWALKLNAK